MRVFFFFLWPRPEYIYTSIAHPYVPFQKNNEGEGENGYKKQDRTFLPWPLPSPLPPIHRSLYTLLPHRFFVNVCQQNVPHGRRRYLAIKSEPLGLDHAR